MDSDLKTSKIFIFVMLVSSLCGASDSNENPSGPLNSSGPFGEKPTPVLCQSALADNPIFILTGERQGDTTLLKFLDKRVTLKVEGATIYNALSPIVEPDYLATRTLSEPAVERGISQALSVIPRIVSGDGFCEIEFFLMPDGSIVVIEMKPVSEAYVRLRERGGYSSAFFNRMRGAPEE